MLTYKVEEYLHWRTRNPDLLFYDLWRVTVTPRWEDSGQVDRLMRQRPEKGGSLFA